MRTIGKPVSHSSRCRMGPGVLDEIFQIAPRADVGVVRDIRPTSLRYIMQWVARFQTIQAPMRT